MTSHFFDTNYHLIYVVLGIHPTVMVEHSEREERDCDVRTAAAKGNPRKLVAIGEISLDFFSDTL